MSERQESEPQGGDSFTRLRAEVERLRLELDRIRQERDDAIGPLVSMQAKVDEAEAALTGAQQNRDRDWVLGMAYALGTDSGYDVPIVPKIEPIKALFDAIRSGARKDALEEAAKVCDRLAQNIYDESGITDPETGERMIPTRLMDTVEADEECAACIRALAQKEIERG